MAAGGNLMAEAGLWSPATGAPAFPSAASALRGW